MYSEGTIVCKLLQFVSVRFILEVMVRETEGVLNQVQFRKSYKLIHTVDLLGSADIFVVRKIWVVLRKLC